MRTIIISNRLPIKVSSENDKYVLTRSEGGLATGLGSVTSTKEKHWIGWPGIHTNDNAVKNQITKQLDSDNLHPVFLSPDQITNFYEGYSNSIIWPLCHYFYTYIAYDSKFWESYKEVNQLFCDESAKIIQPGDTVWIQDYQLMLLPAMLRAKIPDIHIGYFHHIPFPSFELFRVLPERDEILSGLLGADLIGFHTYEYMRHFISAAYRVLGLNCELDMINYDSRKVYVDAFPMGINYPLHNDAILTKEVQENVTKLKSQFGKHKLALSVDRLDYSKGIIHRLRGFELFLERHSEFKEKISLVMVVVPSRDGVDRYADLKAKIDETIGKINGKFSTLNWRPVYYFYRSFPFDELMALYYLADIALVTPLRDGMNLVAKEYVAVKRDKPGVLILSEMAGAAIELTDALIINPNNIDEIEKALVEALVMHPDEQLERMKYMRSIVANNDVNKWAADFISELEKINNQDICSQQKILMPEINTEIKTQFTEANKRILILDYDGTLVPLINNPNQASPGDYLLSILKQLTDIPDTTVVINSGRDPKILEKWFGHLNLALAAEHGAFYKEHGIWHQKITEPLDFTEVIEIMKYITTKTPRSHIEQKKTSVVWHFRNSDAWLAELRETQLINALMAPCTRAGLQIMKGNKIVEVKLPGINKGVEVQRLLEKETYDFILAMGDDVTDEDMFHSLPKNAIAIKIGSVSDKAAYCLPNPKAALSLLSTFIA